MKYSNYSRAALAFCFVSFCIGLFACSPEPPVIASTETEAIVTTLPEADSEKIGGITETAVPPEPSNTPTSTSPPTYTATPEDSPTPTQSEETFELQITQEELTEIVDKGMSSNEEAVMENNTVELTNNAMEIRSQVSQMGFTLPLEVVLSVSADSCEPKVTIISSSVGMFDMPDNGKEGMKAMVRGILLDILHEMSENACIQEIEIDDGVITLLGTIE
jgi:hypothetical protein